MDDFTLDDAHEVLSVIAWHLERFYSEWPRLWRHDLLAALDAIEAQLPEPCEHCGDDQCPTFSIGYPVRKVWKQCQPEAPTARR